MTLNIATDQGLQKVEADIVYIGRWKCFKHYNRFEQVISEFSSGMRITSFSLEAPDKAENPHELMQSCEPHALIKHCRAQLSFYGMQYPVNS